MSSKSQNQGRKFNYCHSNKSFSCFLLMYWRWCFSIKGVLFFCFCIYCFDLLLKLYLLLLLSNHLFLPSVTYNLALLTFLITFAVYWKTMCSSLTFGDTIECRIGYYSSKIYSFLWSSFRPFFFGKSDFWS